MEVPRRIRDLQSQPANQICADCSNKYPDWASSSYGIFMCLDCSFNHGRLSTSSVQYVDVHPWYDIQIKKMEVGGNETRHAFLSQRGIPKETDILAKYTTKAAAAYRDRIQALVDGKPWSDPPATKETIGGSNDDACRSSVGMRRRRNRIVDGYD